MSYYFPEGSRIYFSSTLAAAKTVSILTNANPALATATAHGYSDNDEILLNSGWEDAHEAVWRVDQQSADTFLVLGLDSSNTAFYPAGTGIGSASKVSSWVEIPQWLGIATDGGDPRFTEIAPLSRRNAFKVPTGFNPYGITLTLGHDPANAAWLQMLALSRTLSKTAFKIALGGGGTMYMYGYMACSEMPSLNVNEPNKATVAISSLNRPISYST
jgi:hypothetical protein